MIDKWERENHWEGIRATRDDINKSIFSILLNAFSDQKKTAIIHRAL